MKNLQEYIDQLFWESKGIKDRKSLSREERLAFRLERVSFREGFLKGYDFKEKIDNLKKAGK